jgi:hypothetical protein
MGFTRRVGSAEGTAQTDSEGGCISVGIGGLIRGDGPMNGMECLDDVA